MRVIVLKATCSVPIIVAENCYMHLANCKSATLTIVDTLINFTVCGFSYKKKRKKGKICV